MAKAGYTTTTTAAVALSAATPKTILSVLAPAQFGVDLRGFELSLDGATSTATPVFWELCSLDGTTGGTSSAATVRQEYGRTITAGFSSGSNFTVLVNNAVLLTGTDSFNATATKHGIMRQQTLNNSRHDNFTVKQASANSAPLKPNRSSKKASCSLAWHGQSTF